MKIDRRQFLKTSALSAATVAAPGTFSPLLAQSAAPGESAPGAPERPAIIDTNVHLFDWPFRHLKYGQTDALVAKLRKHGIKQAWAGSFEGLLHKDIGGVNARLAEECRTRGDGMLVPFGSVNLMLPDWEEDLRRCHELHHMPGIRLHPFYQGFTLEHPDFARLVGLATERGLLIQISLELEDPRVQHPLLPTLAVDPGPLIPLLGKVPAAKVVLMSGAATWRIPEVRPLFEMANLMFDISDLEGTGAVGRIIDGTHWNLRVRIPVERLLFGSHAPYFPLESALLKLFESPLTLMQLQAIMEGNARRLLARS
ncbi:MAG: amidohydrolase family protein [Verrucomicrobiota bacterium]|nr:amidohydrolase family protein [Verrucomicrobiota bacterium]